MSGEKSATQIAPVESPQMVSTVKLLILKKGEYTFWSMRMGVAVLIKLRLNALTVIEGAILKGNVEHQEIKGTGMEMQDGLGYDWSYIAQDEPSEFALMAYTSKLLGSNTEASCLESVEAQLVVHQKNEAVYEEKIAVLEFEVKDKSLVELSLKIRNESVKPKQADKPRIITQNPKVLTRFGRVAVSAAKQSSLRATTSTSTFRPVNTATHTNRCWICSSLSKHTVDRKKSFAVATEHLNFSCTKEEADQVSSSRPEEPESHPQFPTYHHKEQKRENHGSPNKEALQSSRQILEEDIARKERNEIDKFDREWNEKKMSIVNEFRIRKNSYPSAICKLENSLPANETQILDLVESEKEDQESREVAPALFGNPIEAESRDKRVHDLSPVVVPDGVVNLGETSNDMVSGSHTALSEPIGDIPAKHVADMGNDVAGADASVLTGNCNQDKAQDTTPSVQQVASPVSDHSMPAIPSFQEIHNESKYYSQPSEKGIQDQEGQKLILPKRLTTQKIQHIHPHDEPSSVISTDPTITENQAAMSSTSEVLVQTTAPPITAQAQIQLGQYLFDLQRNANFNQAASLRTGGVDPLQLLQLSSVRDNMVKSHHDNIQKINIDYQKERTEAIAELRLKYNNKRQEADATYNSQKKEVENNMNTVVMNQLLAACFRRKCQDASGGYAAVQQARQAESMQQQRRFRGTSMYTPGQSSGTQQTPPPIPANPA
ncbi:P-loop containing nucleoside triphosphate hydrolase [Tanacetum coccineum]|uniref:P-loop containing nucleoside triphosphate hydrolase n=1 Tax=Tanacetum coccineum TaxID=301880 RepID=A0ABQ5CZL3_9ASTR